MTKNGYRLSITLSLTAFLIFTNAASAQKDSLTKQNWGGDSPWPQQSTNNGTAQPIQNGYQQPGPAGALPGWGARPGTNGWVQRPGPAGAVPGWAQPGTPPGVRPGSTWSQQPGPNAAAQTGSNWAQQRSQSWAEQEARNAEMTREALQKQANQTPRPQVAQYERWKQEWEQQHPGEPLPNMPTLEKLHHGEIISNIKRDGANMWARRQQDLQTQYQMVKQMQEKKNAAQGITWSPQQWAQWEKLYDGDQRQAAQDYVNNWNKMAEDARLEQANREARKNMGLNY